MSDIEIIRKLLKFRWIYKGMGQLACRSCGALAEESYDDDGSRSEIRIDSCSTNCPWKIAEDRIKEADV